MLQSTLSVRHLQELEYKGKYNFDFYRMFQGIELDVSGKCWIQYRRTIGINDVFFFSNIKTGMKAKI